MRDGRGELGEGEEVDPLRDTGCAAPLRRLRAPGRRRAYLTEPNLARRLDATPRAELALRAVPEISRATVSAASHKKAIASGGSVNPDTSASTS